jgi:gas vesicle protein
MTKRKIVAGILTGIAAGVTIILILSSEKGRETSKRLLKKSTGLKDDLKGKFNDFIDQAQDKLHAILK